MACSGLDIAQEVGNYITFLHWRRQALGELGVSVEIHEALLPRCLRNVTDTLYSLHALARLSFSYMYLYLRVCSQYSIN